MIRNQHGEIQGVRHDELAPMMLNEMQQQQERMAAQDAMIATIGAQLTKLRQVNDSMQAALLRLQVKEQRVAMRR